MKKWTIMVIPEGAGTTRNLTLHSFHLWAPLALLLCATFLIALFYQRDQSARSALQRERQESERLRATVPTTQPGLVSLEQQEAIEEGIRAEYDDRNSVLAAELSDLYDVEAQVRDIHGLPPRDLDGVGVGGKGGGLVSAEADDAAWVAMPLPPNVIYALHRPSADLLLQEIRLRKDSLRLLLADMEEQRDRAARMPSLWPARHPSRYISSSFGNRRDPINRKVVRHHDGTDIVAPYGSGIVATANGVVFYSGQHRFLGNVVRIDHGYGIQTHYGHLQKRLVKEGDVVERGQEIGRLGSTGRSTGAHVHYEVTIENKPVNSAKYLGN